MTTAQKALGSQLRVAVLRLSRRLRQESVGDVTASQLSALTAIRKRGELTLGELAAHERIAPPSMTRIATRLEERGLVERRTDATDRRVARVALTAAGESLLSEIRTRRDAFLTARLEGFTAEERAALGKVVPLLERLASDDP